MNLGINADFTKDISFEERIRLIKTAGFSCVMMFYHDKNSFEEQVRIIKNHGLKIANCHCPFGNMNNLWTDINAIETILNVQSAIDSCQTFGVHNLVVHCTDGMNPPPVTDVGLKYFQGLCQYADRQNVNLAFENIQRPEYLQPIYENIKVNSVKFCYDSGHENCFSRGSDCLSDYGDKLVALHLHDNNGDDDSHMVLGDGNIDFKPIAKKLSSLLYIGALTLEVMKNRASLYDDVSNEEYVNKCFDRLSQFSRLVTSTKKRTEERGE